jgi:hypothetical protein
VADTQAMNPAEPNHSVRRIVLPSGRAIEVVRFDETGLEVRQLHICPACESDLVQPHDWHPVSQERWGMTLECPNCGWSESGTYSAAEVELFEEQIDHGVSQLIADLRRVTQTNMAAEIENFVAALRQDLILPEDF